jgi:EAL domain-containing protein (putative c-di-GMP-specific phosphodiesterase class I)
VLHCACQQLRQWQQRDDAFAELRLHVNLSGIDVAHPGLVSRVNQALADARLKPQHLTLELTENTLMQRLEGGLPALTQLRQSGIGLAIDDFGAGYSSLRHLSSLPVDSLKLDCGFVADLERGIREETVVRAIVMMGQSLGKTVMAEGIESAGQLARLKQAGCQAGQGFFLSPPLPPDEVDVLLDRLLADAPRAAPAAPDTRASQLH